MTNEQLIEKLLKHGFTKCVHDSYGKKIGTTTVIVNFRPYDSRITCPDIKDCIPFVEEFSSQGLETYCSYSTAGINLALSKRKYF